MDRDLIIKALKSTCGNKNLRFQVIVRDYKLHIYINRQADYIPNYTLLTDTITRAIASLSLDSLAGIWLYSRKLGEVEPDWQIFLDPPTEIDEEKIDTLGNSKQEEKGFNFPEIEEFVEEDRVKDTGLLLDSGLIHGQPLEEEEINTFTFVEKIKTDSSKTQTDTPVEVNQLIQYCFVSNQKILTGDIIPPDKEIIRLVKFFHHLAENNQLKILPALDEYFKKAKVPNTENSPPALKKWVKQITELNEEDRNTVAIWLSRYCFDSSTTLAEFKAMEEKKAAAKKVRRNNTEYSFTPAKKQISTSRQDEELIEDKFKLPPIVDKLVIPLVWTLAVIILICLGIYTDRVSVGSTSRQIPELCQTTIGSPNYCRLGVNLAGKDAIARASESIFPLTEVTETVANYGCERFANVKAGLFDDLDPTQNPVISSQGEKIFPHVYVVQVVQKDLALSQNIRVGCVYTAGVGERSPAKLASEIIPLNWPSEHYQQTAVSESNLSFGRYTNLINLGLYTLFSAVGIAIASEFKLGLRVTNRPQTVYLVALILGIVQLVAVNLPIFNLIASIAFSLIAILIVSQLIKNFQLNWQDGYPIVAAGILTIVATQFLLYGISWQLIISFVRSTKIN